TKRHGGRGIAENGFQLPEIGRQVRAAEFDAREHPYRVAHGRDHEAALDIVDRTVQARTVAQAMVDVIAALGRKGYAVAQSPGERRAPGTCRQHGMACLDHRPLRADLDAAFDLADVRRPGWKV